MTGLEQLATLLGGSLHLLAIFDGKGHGFFAENIQPGGECLDREVLVHISRQGYRDGIQIGFGQHLVEIVVEVRCR